MKIKELQNKLLEAYNTKNLNRISHILIDLYKNKQYLTLQKIADVISDFVTITITPEGKGFSKFMMLYHPDRSGFHIDNLNRLTDQENFDGLLGYSHILKLDRIEELSLSLNSYEDIDYSPVYVWDIDELRNEGFHIISDRELSKEEKTARLTGLDGYNFYDAIKLREFGDIETEYPSYYLEDIEEFELSSAGICDLDGIQYCVNAKVIDVSNNDITDLTPLTELSNLEELNLSDNKVGIIDALSNLTNLRSILLCNNCIEDISPLFELENLEYADLSGNCIDDMQINQLNEMGISVNYEY
jgi:Leucine-rich repeat (LRR) protein